MAKVLVIYHSDTGNTHKLAKMVAAGAESAGGMEVKLVAADQVDMTEAAAAAGLAIGSPDYFSYMAGTVKSFFDQALYNEHFKGKPCVCFGTHGGGAKVLEVLERLAKAIGLKQAAPGVLVKGLPTDADAPAAKALGEALAKAAGK